MATNPKKKDLTQRRRAAEAQAQRISKPALWKFTFMTFPNGL
jgi:hypothetical protein